MYNKTYVFLVKSTAQFAWQDVGLMLSIQCVLVDFARFQELLALQQALHFCQFILKDFS